MTAGVLGASDDEDLYEDEGDDDEGNESDDWQPEPPSRRRTPGGRLVRFEGDAEE